MTRGPSPLLDLQSRRQSALPGCDDSSSKLWLASAVGFPHLSSATTARRNGSPTSASDGRIAFQLAAGPGTRSKAGCTGSSQNSYVANASTEVFSSTFASTLVCKRKPGEPCRRSPSRTVSVSPARR